MTKDRNQSVSHFSEEQLTPLEQKFAEAKANRDAGVEPFKMVPSDVWEDIVFAMSNASQVYSVLNMHLMKIDIDRTLEKMKQL